MNTIRRIIRIGNSDGIILPKNIMHFAHMNDTFYVKLIAEKGKITLLPASKTKLKK